MARPTPLRPLLRALSSRASAPSATPAGANARALHSSLPATQSASEITSDFLARLTANSSSSSSSSSRAAADDKARGMIGSVGMRDAASEDGRRTFQPNEFNQPHMYKESNLYPAQKPRPKPPLLGPSKRIAKRIDPFFIRKSNPLDQTLNPLMSLQFVNQLGRIKPRSETGLTWRSQRLVGKMVRRARAMGIVPLWSNRPAPGGLGERDVSSKDRM